MSTDTINRINDIIMDCIAKETEYAKGYIKLNPEDEKNRIKERNLIIEGMLKVWNEIKEREEV